MRCSCSYSGTIITSKSHFEVTARAIVITLIKAVDVKWTMLEKTQHRASLSNFSSSSNHVAAGDQTPADHNQSANSSNSETNDFNDPSIDNVVVATPPSQVQSVDTTTASTASPTPARSTQNTTNTTTSSESGNPGEPRQDFHTNPLYKPPASDKNPPTAAPSPSPYVPPSEQEMMDPSYREKQLCQPSTTGLSNLGNSCFMNSVIQCLSNTPELRDYFVKGHYLANINSGNPLGFEGRLAKCFCTILRKLWSGEYEFFSPRKLLDIVAKRSKYFGGNSQHDTHEFMSYLIDGLHEDLNRVKQKPVTEPVEMEGRPDR